MEAVSTRVTNFSVQAVYAGSVPRWSPRSAAVARASAGPSPASRRSRIVASVTAGSWVARREASSTSATRARHCGTVTSAACSAQVTGRSRSPRSSSRRATVSSYRATSSGSGPVVGHQGRWWANHPEASAASMKWRSPVKGSTCRRPRANAGSSRSERRTVQASSTWSREAWATALRSEERAAARAQAPAQFSRSASRAAARLRSRAVNRALGHVSLGRRRPMRLRPMSPCATRTAQRTPRSSSMSDWPAAMRVSSHRSRGCRHASRGIPSTSSPSMSSSSASVTRRTTSGQTTSPPGSTAARSAPTSSGSSRTPRRTGRRGQ